VSGYSSPRRRIVQLIPLLRAWAEIEDKKVRARIIAVIQTMESRAGALPSN
jgi:hypothetical protein